jgi:hypothetical protein
MARPLLFAWARSVAVSYSRVGRIVASIVFISGLAASARAACVPIASVPFTISAPGQYCVTADLTTSQTGMSGGVITIDADNVVLDFQGHKFDATSGGNFTNVTGVYSLNHKGNTVRNGLMVGFYVGIHFDMTSDTRDNVIEDMRFSLSRSRAMQMEGFNNVIRRNLVVDTIDGWVHPDGFSACEQNFNGSIQVYNNTVSHVGGQNDSSPDGMMIYCYNSLIIGNRVVDASDQGLGIGGGFCKDNVIIGSTHPYYVEYPVPGCTMVGGTEYVLQLE